MYPLYDNGRPIFSPSPEPLYGPGWGVWLTRAQWLRGLQQAGTPHHIPCSVENDQLELAGCYLEARRRSWEASEAGI